MRIQPNVFAEVDYVLSGEDGEVLDDSSAEDGGPLRYVHGYGMLVPGLEKRLEGHDRFAWPSDAAVVTLSTEQLRWLLQGVDLAAIKRHPKRYYARVS